MSKLSEKLKLLRGLEGIEPGLWVEAEDLENRLAKEKKITANFLQEYQALETITEGLEQRLAVAEAKIAKVRAQAEATIDFEEGWDLQERLLSILDDGNM